MSPGGRVVPGGGRGAGAGAVLGLRVPEPGAALGAQMACGQRDLRKAPHAREQCAVRGSGWFS